MQFKKWTVSKRFCCFSCSEVDPVTTSQFISHQINLIQKIILVQNRVYPKYVVVLNMRLHAGKFSRYCFFTKISVILKHDQHYRYPLRRSIQCKVYRQSDGQGDAGKKLVLQIDVRKMSFTIRETTNKSVLLSHFSLRFK